MPLAGLVQVQGGDETWANGYLWQAVYDGLGRRLRTLKRDIADSELTGPVLTLDSYYDPQVEFMEVGVSVNGARTWKVYGPDLSGKYGGLQGIGGLEATIDEATGTVTPLVNDAFGNVVGTISNGSLVWNPARVGSYGVLPGSSAPVLDGTSVTLAQATLWRSFRIDPTGLYYMGARYYDPNSGRFLSPDPLGHAAGMDLYSYANGDPCNGLDPTGRFGKDVVPDIGQNFKNIGIGFQNAKDQFSDFAITLATDPKQIGRGLLNTGKAVVDYYSDVSGPQYLGDLRTGIGQVTENFNTQEKAFRGAGRCVAATGVRVWKNTTRLCAAGSGSSPI